MHIVFAITEIFYSINTRLSALKTDLDTIIHIEGVSTSHIIIESKEYRLQMGRSAVLETRHSHALDGSSLS